MLPVLLLTTLFLAPVRIRGQFAQTSATCSTDFSWMANSKGSSPCQTAANIDALCNNGNWNIPQLNASVKYNNPKQSDGTATLCTCSWASYNLISACIACQGFPEQIAFWGDYSSDCSGKISESYWPSTIALPSGIVLPFWSTTNPTTWPNQKFTSSEAKATAQKGHADVDGTQTSTTQKSKSTPVGAIVGGVVGGVVVIAAFIGIALFMLRRQKNAKSSKASSTTLTDQDSRPPHQRQMSDVSLNSNMKSVAGWTSINSSAQLVTSSNPVTGHSHNPSASSTFPFFSSIVRSNNATQSPSPPPGTASSSQHRRPEDVVSPFTLPPTNENPDQKRSHGEWPVYDQPNAPPSSAVRMEVTPMQSNPQRNRYNPPAYSESNAGNATPPRHRAGQGSTDSDHSTPSSSNIGQPRTAHIPVNSGSSIGHMGITPMTPMTEYASELASPISRGRSLAGPSTDHKRRSSTEDDEPSLA